MAVKHVRFTLGTPLVLCGLAHFDSLLGGVISGGLPMDDAEFVERMPLTRQDGIYRCSAAFWFGIPAGESVAAFQQSIQKPTDIARFAEHTASNNGRTLLSTHEKEYRNKLNRYRTITVDHVDFLCDVLDDRIDDLRHLLRKIYGVGKKSRQGWGEVTGIAMADYDGDPWLLPGVEPTVSRAIPVDTLRGSAISSAAYQPSFETYAPPYYGDRRAICAVPPVDTVLDYDFDAEEAL